MKELFEIGRKVYLKWSKHDVAHSGLSAGWYLAELQDCRIEDDCVKFEYFKEPGSIYKVDVSHELETKMTLCH